MIPKIQPVTNRSSGGHAPEGTGSRPVHHCDACGTSYTGGSHACRRPADRQAAGGPWRDAEPEAG